jgi:hypothetical protein
MESWLDRIGGIFHESAFHGSLRLSAFMAGDFVGCASSLACSFDKLFLLAVDKGGHIVGVYLDDAASSHA